MHIIVFLLAACLASPAVAQICGAEDETLAGRSIQIDQAARELDREIGQIESVPPSDAEYIDREQEQSLRQRNSARFNLVLTHPFYRAHQVRKHYDVISRNLKAARDARRVADQVIYLSVVLSRYADLLEALRDYIDFDSKRHTRILPKNTESIWTVLVRTKEFVFLFLQCGVRQMREPD